MRLARTCYDHLAGRLAIALADALIARGYLVFGDGVGLVTDEGQHFFRDFGLPAKADAHSRRPLCRTCLDWSERRPHLAGQLGASLLDRTLELGWIAKTPESRALQIARIGERGFVETFGLPSDWRMTRMLRSS